MNVNDLMTSEAMRCLTTMTTLAPESRDYGELLGNLEHLLGIKQFLADTMDDCAVEKKTEKVVELHQIMTHDTLPEPFEFTAEETPFDEPAAVYSKEEVRAALGKARVAGANVTELLQSFGVDRFPAFPEGRYAELMEKLKEYV